jgi:recombination protein RecA
LLENAAIADEIERKIKAKLGIGVPRAVADLPEDAPAAAKAEKASATSLAVNE